MINDILQVENTQLSTSRFYMEHHFAIYGFSRFDEHILLTDWTLWKHIVLFRSKCCASVRVLKSVRFAECFFTVGACKWQKIYEDELISFGA